MQNITKTAEQYLNKFASLMSSAGYEITEIMQEALLQEFTNCAEADSEFEGEDSAMALMHALEYAASYMANDLT